MYYDGTKLLSMMDINGERPELYFCTSNRTAGKTTFYTRYVINRWFKHKEKFAFLYRYNYELDDCANKIFGDVKNLFFDGHAMTHKKKHNGAYSELYLDEIPCGYALSLNNADLLRKLSHLLNDTKVIVFDEFQSETNHYCSNEITKFISIHTSLARGNGEQTRYLPVILLGNNVSLLNPYFCELGISSRLKADTKFLRGDGFVVEQGHNQSAQESMQSSGFYRAFKDNRYTRFSAEGLYLNDQLSFVGKLTGKSRYLVTLKSGGKEFAIRDFADEGLLYCDDRVDSTFPKKIVLDASDHDIDFVMLEQNSLMVRSMRMMFECGRFRFKNLECKNVIFKFLRY